MSFHILNLCRSQWPRDLRRRSAVARLLRLWVWIPPRAWMFVCCECCVLLGRGLGEGLIPRPEESYRLWRVQWVWSRNLKNEEAMTRVGQQRHRKKILNLFSIHDHIHNSFAKFILYMWKRVSNPNETWNIACFVVHYFGTVVRIFTNRNHSRNPTDRQHNHQYITIIYNLLMLINP